MTIEELKAIRERCDAATPGPWRYVESDGWCNPVPADGTCAHEEGSNCCLDCDDWRVSAPAFIDTPRPLNNGSYDGLRDEDALFAVHAREDVPALLAEVERLTKERKEIEAEVHRHCEDCKYLRCGLKNYNVCREKSAFTLRREER
jgi:hypothetical protein